ncbi:MAG: NADH-quinone oxidoreductase subunit L [Actinomycetota bacterium]|nr:NADH-quinone oxidoreductase subunit L [Actinomycetota bacterium]
MTDMLWLLPAFPLFGALVIMVLGRRLGEPKSGWLAAAMPFASFIVAVSVYFDLLSRDEEDRHQVVRLFSWIPVGELQIDVALLADPLSVTMALFITGIGSLIHLYAIGYMHGDPKFSKFFLYLNLFVFSMLMLVLGENLLVTFLGWEGVGACSYFLISFWHTRDSAAVAGKKAFVTNRIGDFGVMTAMFLAFSTIGSVSYESINDAASSGAIAQVTATAIALLLFVGACGKSAQLPLYLWLPDAMEGPTPVSALIHAATMVTSGVFLMTRMSPVLHASYEWAPMTIATIGAATALFAASIAVAQNDIKKVLAYSTVSQLGYMFLAVGSGAYVAAIFHMVTHAFFKALLFLGSGSVIHGMHHEQDMRRMGALRKLMPVTAITFIIGWLAIAGVPPFAGFWSKDEILLYVYANNRGLYVVGLITALLTAYYMTRQVIMVFYGEAKWKDHAHEHGAHGDFEPHESPKIMLIPLVVLAGLSVVGGAMQLPFSSKLHFLEHWLAPVVHDAEADIKKTWAYDNKYILLGVAVIVAFAGIAAAYAVYAKKKVKAIEPAILEQAWMYDAAAAKLVGGPGRAAFNAVAWADSRIVDGAVNGTATLVRGVAGQVRKSQSGFTRVYAALMTIGAVALLAWFVLRGIA